jgi:hypothetical protein
MTPPHPMTIRRVSVADRKEFPGVARLEAEEILPDISFN